MDAASVARKISSAPINRLMESGLLLLVVIPLGTALREAMLVCESPSLPNLVFATVVVIKLALITAAMFVVLTPSRLVLRWAKLGVFITAPLPLVLLASIGRARLAADLAHEPRRREQQKPRDFSKLRRTEPRLVILLFDEFDQYLAFEKRPESVFLPELDRLRQASVYAKNAYPVRPERLNRHSRDDDRKAVRAARPLDASKLLLTFEDNHTALWGEEANLFSTVAETRQFVGVAGWYHPYCRVLPNSLTACSWEEALPEECFNEPDLLKGSANIARRLQALLTLDSYLGIAQAMPFLGEDVEKARQVQLDSYNKILHASLSLAADSRLDLIFVHWPIPHPFGIYNRQTGRLGADPAADYLDNLGLVDHTLVLIRQALEASSLWDSTALLVTGDHPFRREVWKGLPWHDRTAYLLENTDNPRVPFLLKLPGRKAGMRYAGTFNLVLVHDISLALLRGEVSTEAEFIHWMDRHRDQQVN